MDDRWDTACDPMHQLEIAVDPVHNEGKRLDKPHRNPRGVGPATAFGHEMLRRTRVPQGLIACAHGGTSMSQWNPALKDKGGQSLYGAMWRRFVKNGGKVAGMIWYQGESDTAATSFRQYGPRMEAFVAALRRDTGDARLPVAVVQITRVVSATMCVEGWNHVQEQQRRLSLKLPAVAMVPAVDLTLDDAIHVSGVGCRVLGVRLAQAMAVLRKLPKSGKPPIQLKRITVGKPGGTFGSEIHVEFDHVEGELTAGGGRALGFAFARGSEAVPAIYNTQLRGSCVTLRTILPAHEAKDLMLHYGLGTDPDCNIVDGGGRSLPVFGPVAVSQGVPSTPYVRHLLVSEELPGVGKLQGLACPGPLASLPLRPRLFPNSFCDIHLTHPQDGLDHLVYFGSRVQCDVAMTLNVLLGYDGPVKLWVDGQELFHDPNGTNPAYPDMCKRRWTATAGEHEILVALGTNGGKAWGIMMRLERADVTARKYMLDPSAYPLPRWVV
jgi:sialate O-acetylesterase